MRDPAVRIDLEIKAAIEGTRQFLAPYVRNEYWKADPNPHVEGARWLIKTTIEGKFPPSLESVATSALLEQANNKRKNKPTLNYRNEALQMAAGRLVSQGYDRSRNDEMRHKESASSIIHQALRRLGDETEEKTIKDIVLELDPETLFPKGDKRSALAVLAADGPASWKLSCFQLLTSVKRMGRKIRAARAIVKDAVRKYPQT